jgi:hypothetical protein
VLERDLDEDDCVVVVVLLCRALDLKPLR